MNRLFVDTGAWYALIDKKDPDHFIAKKFFDSNNTPLITTNFIFDETSTLLMSRLNWDIACKFGEKLKDSKFVSLASITDDDEIIAWEIFREYKEAGFSYTDCTSYAFMGRLKIDTAFTFDAHFKTMKFKVVP